MIEATGYADMRLSPAQLAAERTALAVKKEQARSVLAAWAETPAEFALFEAMVLG
jgi:hypothetical protein